MRATSADADDGPTQGLRLLAPGSPPPPVPPPRARARSLVARLEAG